ncbi:MAG: hypothetical protein ABIR18_00890 [Chitinophagaceae bacterium]
MQNLLDYTRRLTNNYCAPADASNTYRVCLSAIEMFEVDLCTHMDLECGVLFPEMLRVLDSYHAPANLKETI